MSGFRLSAHGPGEGVVFRRGLPLGEGLFHQDVYDAAILGVHADQPPVLPGAQQGAVDSGVVYHEDARICHEQLEAGHSLVHQQVHLLILSRG